MPRRPAPEDASQPSGAEDTPQPPAAREAALLLLRLVPVAVPLLLFVLIVAKGIKPALDERAERLEDWKDVKQRYDLASKDHEAAVNERNALRDPMGRARRRRLMDAGKGTSPDQPKLSPPEPQKRGR